MLIVLAGCTAAGCDPNQAELFTGIGCAVSGSYGAREAGLRSNLAAAQANELQRQADATRARAGEASAREDLVRRQEQLALLDKRLRELKRQLEAARQRQGVNQVALRRAQDELAALQARRARVSPQSGDDELRALEGPTRELGEKLSREGL
jgi:hypothetical protein